MKQRGSLDVAKFLCAILVLLIHTNPFASYSKILTFGLRNVVTVIAVPFFFCCSGYLVAEKLKNLQNYQERKCYIGKYLKRLIVIYLVWSAVYFPFVVLRWIREGFSYALVLKYLWDFFLEGSFSTIWFLPALMSAVALYWLLRQKYNSKTIFFIGCGIYVITLLLSSYYGITARIPGLMFLGEQYYRLFDNVKNGVLFGLVFVSMGGMLSEETWFHGFTRKKALIGGIACYGLLCIEAVACNVIGNVKGVDTVITILPLTICAFIFALSYDIPSSNICITLRKHSMLIFLCQRIPITLIEMFLDQTILATNSVVNCLTVSAVSFFISHVLLQLSKKWHWLKKIY